LFNERQRKVINRLMDGFEDKLTSSKWAKLAKCSQDTALRDIADMVERKILARKRRGARSTSYVLKLPQSRKAEHPSIFRPEQFCFDGTLFAPPTLKGFPDFLAPG
jgi:DeoR/GlpR family transcriptional regulator of sugar metabolism